MKPEQMQNQQQTQQAPQADIPTDDVRRLAEIVAGSEGRLSAHVWRSATAGNRGGWMVSRALMFPLTLRMLPSMRALQDIQPQMAEALAPVGTLPQWIAAFVLKLERLRAKEAGLTREALTEEAASIAAEQRTVRANFIFLLGGHVEDEFEEAEHSHEIQEGRLENTARQDINAAISQMTRVGEGLAALNPGAYTLTSGDEPERVTGTYVTVSAFELLGVDPLLGRNFAEILRTVWPEPFASQAIGIFRRTLEADPEIAVVASVSKEHLPVHFDA